MGPAEVVGWWWDDGQPWIRLSDPGVGSSARTALEEADGSVHGIGIPLILCAHPRGALQHQLAQVLSRAGLERDGSGVGAGWERDCRGMGARLEGDGSGIGTRVSEREHSLGSGPPHAVSVVRLQIPLVSPQGEPQ